MSPARHAKGGIPEDVLPGSIHRLLVRSGQAVGYVGDVPLRYRSHSLVHLSDVTTVLTIRSQAPLTLTGLVSKTL
jgi:hypothetical protein